MPAMLRLCMCYSFFVFKSSSKSLSKYSFHFLTVTIVFLSSHGRTQGSQGGQGSFSVRGLKICVKYFTDRGHKVIAFAPKYRRFHVSPEDRKAMDELETQGILSFTPSRTMENGQKIASYDDRQV